MPDPLVGRPVVLAGPEAADVADAERAILELDRSAKALANTEALARLLLRAESVNSSKIEGLEVSPRRLLRADAARAHGEEPTDVTATEVLGNIDAMNYAIDAINRGKTFSLDLLREVHRRLLASTPLVKIGGIIRTTQNWIGGSSYNPCSASYVPPPSELVHDLLIDLCDFCNGDELPVVVQAALAHAQFEAIHPFADGNGRVGRAIIHMVFRRRRLTASITPPVSLVLATMSKDYVAGLNAMCYRGAPTSAQAVEGFNRWIATFASACSRAVADSFIFERRIGDLQKKWLRRLGRVRADSAVLRLLEALPGTPIVTASEVRAMLGVSLPSALQAIERLTTAEILHPATARQRRQVFEAREIINLFTNLERQLASPTGDTFVAHPARRVPAKPRIPKR
ncbi:MAG: Fic family protein [Candidatus Aquilonibacter sp.]